MPVNTNRNKKRQQQYTHQPRIMSRRKDEITRMLVDLGTHYASMLGVSKAAEFLREKNVPQEVIERVLHRPPKQAESE